MPTTTYSSPTMGAAVIGARTDAAGAAVVDTTAEELRLNMSMFTSGCVSSTSSFAVSAQSSPNMSVRVGSGTAKADIYVVAGSAPGQGTYVVRLDEAFVNLTIEAADSSQARVDAVYLVVRDNPYDSSGRALPQLAVRKGDPGLGSPFGDSSWRASTLLAVVNVPAGATAISASNILNIRPPSKLVGAIDANYLSTTLYSGGPKGRLPVSSGGGSGIAYLSPAVVDGSSLVSDSTSASGLAWTDLGVSRTIYVPSPQERTSTSTTPIPTGYSPAFLTFNPSGTSIYKVEARLIVFAEPGTRVKLAVGASAAIFSSTTFDGPPLNLSSDTVGSRDYSVEYHSGSGTQVTFGRAGGQRVEVVVRSTFSNTSSSTGVWGLQFGSEVAGGKVTVAGQSYMTYTRIV